MSTAAPTPPVVSDLPADVKVGIVAARFNAHITDELLSGCQRRLLELGLTAEQVESYRVPGAFELPVAAKALAATNRFAAIVCIGAVVRGDTPHFDYVAGECARGCMNVGIETGLPVIFGVLTTNTEQQALDRTGGTHGHGGERAAEAAIEMVCTLKKMQKP